MDALRVVAGALVDVHGRVLIAQRPEGRAFAGRWEFPGGKQHAHETPRDALHRELREELGIEVSRARPLIRVRHRYASEARPVRIDCWLVERWRGEIEALDGQQLRWCEREELPAADILEADRAIVTALRLPATFVYAADPEALVERLPGPRGRARVAWLVPALVRAAAGVRGLHALREYGDCVFVLDPHAPPVDADGCVYSHTPPPAPAGGRGTALLGRVVHGAAEARAAAGEGADFLIVPDRDLPADEFAALADCGLPFYVNVARAAATDTAAAAAATVAGVVSTTTATGRLWWPGAPLTRASPPRDPPPSSPPA